MKIRNKKGNIKVALVIFDLVFFVNTILIVRYWNCNKEFSNAETIISSILAIIFLLIIGIINITVIEVSARKDEQKESIEYTKEIPSSAVHISEEDHNRHIEKEERAFEKNRRSDDRSEPSSTAKDKNTQEKDNISNDTTTSKTENDTNGFTIDTTSDTNSNSSQSSDASYPSSPRIIEIEETPSVPEPTAQKGKNQ